MDASEGFLHAKRKTQASTATGLSQACAVAGRILVFLSLLLLAVTPLTETFWNFDNFLRGGQDFEFNFLAFLVVLCLVLLLAQRANQRCSIVPTLQRWLRVLLESEWRVTVARFVSLHALLDQQPIPSLSLELYSLPLRV